MKVRNFLILFIIVVISGNFEQILAQRGGSRSGSISRTPTVSKPAPVVKAPSPPTNNNSVKNSNNTQQANKQTTQRSDAVTAPSARPMPKAPSKPLTPLTSSGDLKNQTPQTSYANKNFKQLPPSDQKLLREAKANGTLFKTRDEAANDFKSRYSSSYQNKFQAEPATRPAYIPQTYASGGVTYNINYNPVHGGYGYTNSLGAFIMYDAMSDAIMMNHLMHHHGYVHDIDPNTVIVQQRSSVLDWFLAIVVTCFIIFVIILLIRR